MAEGCKDLGAEQYKWLCSLYERAPLGLFRADENWVLVDANPQFASMLGYGSKDEVIGLNLLTRIVVDVDKLLALPEILAEKGSVDAYRVRARRRDGTIVWLSLYCALTKENGITLFDGLAIDFTERKRLADDLRHERRSLNRLIGTLPGIVYTATINGEPNLVFVSPQIKALLGVPPHEVLSKGGFFRGMVHPDDWEALRLWVDRFKKEGCPVYSSSHSVEIRLLDSKGSIRWFRNMAVCEKEEGEDTPLLHGVMFETTELRRVEEELRHAQKMEALGRLVSGIAHDFKNILTAIMGFADMGKDECQEGSMPHYFFSVILEQSEKASSLINKLLNFARREEPEVELVNPAAMLKSVADVLSRTLPSNIEVKLELEDDLPFVKCDEVEMEQVLLNLAINARDAMPGGGRLTVYGDHCEVHPSAVSSLPPGKYLRIVVEDTGEGMSPEVLERAMEPFFTTKERGVGTGLGLPQVMGIVQSHGGHFFLESEVGKGTKAIIYLPAFFDVLSSTEEPEAGEDIMPHTQSVATKGSVLVVDDEREVRRLLSLLLEDAGFRVYAAKDGEEALDLFERLQGGIDLVVTDVVMPRMGGVELVARLREKDPQLPIILVSGYSSSFSVSELGGVTGVVFLPKPITKDDLNRAVEQVLSGDGGG